MQRKLRYFRIVFSKAKLNIKEDKVSNLMRSLPLSELVSVEALHESSSPKLEKSMKASINSTQAMLSKYEIEQKYDLSTYTWPFNLVVSFSDRSFKLSALSYPEYNEWLRIFSLIV